MQANANPEVLLNMRRIYNDKSDDNAPFVYKKSIFFNQGD